MPAPARSDPTALEPDRHRFVPPGLPEGALPLIAARWRAAEPDAARAGLAPPSVAYDDRELARVVADELTAPLRLEDWPSPTEPRQVPGGWVHDEVLDDDRSGFESVLAGEAHRGPEAVAAACQQLRFPVTPYRRLPATAPAGPVDHASGEPGDIALSPSGPGATGPASRRPIRIVDLSTHWAGPLATMLLADAGAEVVKVDPDCRPDGFRARPALHRHLNGAKDIVDLDLRRDGDRRRFETLLAEADLLVESFSRRVLPNLGYDGERLAHLQPTLSVLSIKAFPAGSAEADWLAYGPGVHAASGLGLLTDRPVPAPIAYPDVVAGVTAYARAVRLLADRSGGGPARRAEVSLAGAIAPLVRTASSRHSGPRPLAGDRRG